MYTVRRLQVARFGIVGLLAAGLLAAGGGRLSGEGTGAHTMAAAAACGSSWQAAPGAGLGAGATGRLLSIAAAGSTDLWAVGAYTPGGAPDRTLIEHGDGTAWRLVPSPNADSGAMPGANVLESVAALGPADAWAVGSAAAPGGTRALIEHWDGTAWQIVPAPSPGDAAALHAVAGAGTGDVWAAGSNTTNGQTTPLIVHWSGARWTPALLPGFSGAGGLRALAVAAADDIWAVGWLGAEAPNAAGHDALIAHWDGQGWHVEPLPGGGNLWAAVALGRQNLWAAGPIPTPPPGQAQTIILGVMHLAGGQIVGLPLLNGPDSQWAGRPNEGQFIADGAIRGLTALAPNDIWAVGDYTPPGAGPQTLAAHWDGSTWLRQPALPDHIRFAAVTTAGAGILWAAGQDSAPDRPLLARYGPLPCAPAAPPRPGAVAPVADPHDPAVAYFPAVGHTLRGAFRVYWEAHGGLAQFGYPLTEEFPEQSDTDGRTYTLQYFERNRFEYHPELPVPFQVSLGLLGRVVTAGRAGEAPFQPTAPAAWPGALYFAPTQHAIAPAFVAHWQSHGGLPVYGYPISEAFQETSATDGKPYMVQYFERNRFEYHPELPAPFRVSLGLLGVQVLQARGWLP